MYRPLFIAALFLTAACDIGGGGGGSSAYNDGCSDGRGIGYANGLQQGENCLPYDDDPGQRSFDTGNLNYNDGYEDCYPDGYSDGYNEGANSSGCR